MISRIEGQIVSVAGGSVHVRCGHVTYAVLVPAADQQRLATMTGETAEFRTLQYLESQGQGSAFIPRLVGFSSADELAFFELFTTVKGMGNRKALRALAIPFASVAEAIAAKDLDMLKSLPEIGRRTAETIVAELHGKVNRFVELKPGVGVDRDGPQQDLARDATRVLVELGETPVAARQLVERALTADPTLDTAEDLLAATFRLRELPS